MSLNIYFKIIKNLIIEKIYIYIWKKVILLNIYYIKI